MPNILPPLLGQLGRGWGDRQGSTRPPLLMSALCYLFSCLVPMVGPSLEPLQASCLRVPICSSSPALPATGWEAKGQTGQHTVGSGTLARRRAKGSRWAKTTQGPLLPTTWCLTQCQMQRVSIRQPSALQ